MYKTAQQLPTEKLEYPITEAQEIGWETTPLVCWYVLVYTVEWLLRNPWALYIMFNVPIVH